MISDLVFLSHEKFHSKSEISLPINFFTEKNPSPDHEPTTMEVDEKENQVEKNCQSNKILVCCFGRTNQNNLPRKCGFYREAFDLPPKNITFSEKRTQTETATQAQVTGFAG